MEAKEKENNTSCNYKNQEAFNVSKKEILIRIPYSSIIEKCDTLIEKGNSTVENITIENVYVTINHLTIDDKHTENK